MNFIAWSGIALLFCIIIGSLIQGGALLDNSNISLEALVLVILILIWLIHRGYTQAASIILVLSSWLVTVYQAFTGSGVYDTSVAGELIIVLVCGLLLGWQATAGLSLLSILSIWGMAILETHGLLHTTMDNIYDVTRGMTIMFMVSAILMYLILNSLQHYMTAVRVSEERFRKFFDASPLPIAISRWRKAGLWKPMMLSGN